MKKLFALTALLTSIMVQAQTTWYEIPTGSDKQLNTICFASDAVGYIGGNDSLLLKTVDGGATWSEINYSGITFALGGEHFVNLKFVTESMGYAAVGPYSGTFKTTDGGLNWTPIVFVGVMCYNQGLYFWDENNGMVGGAGCFQGEYIERISGGTWISSTVNSPSSVASDLVKDIDFLNSNFGLAVSESRFLRTTDGGVTWDTIPSGTPNLLTSVEIINDTLAYAGYIDTTTGYGALVTHDAGLTWGMESSMATFYYPDYHDVAEAPNGYLYAACATDFGSAGLMFEDDGSGWWFYPLDHPLRSIDSYGDSIVFAVGDSGYVVTNTDPAMLNLHKKEISVDEVLLFPNPATDQITFFVNGQADYHLQAIRILDISGREVYSTTDPENTLNVSHLTPGMYVLQLQVEGQDILKKFMKE